MRKHKIIKLVTSGDIKMNTCGTREYDIFSTKTKVTEVKAWHKIPTSDKAQCMKWLITMT